MSALQLVDLVGCDGECRYELFEDHEVGGCRDCDGDAAFQGGEEGPHEGS